MGERFAGFVRKEVSLIPKCHCSVSRMPPIINEDKKDISFLQGGYTRASTGSCCESALTHL